jgi:hypothetical protein
VRIRVVKIFTIRRPLQLNLVKWCNDHRGALKTRQVRVGVKREKVSHEKVSLSLAALRRCLGKLKADR